MFKRKCAIVHSRMVYRKRQQGISIAHSYEVHSRVFVVGKRKPNALPDPVITKEQIEQFRRDIAQYVQGFEE